MLPEGFLFVSIGGIYPIGQLNSYLFVAELTPTNHPRKTKLYLAAEI